MKYMYPILLNFVTIVAFGQPYKVPDKNNYPIDQTSSLINYFNTVSSPFTKSKLYKYIHQFLALQNFDRVTEVKTKVVGYYSGQVIDKAILYQDEEEEKIFGNGFVDFV